MESHHTPEPWREPHAGSIRAADGRMVADCFHLIPSHLKAVEHADEALANADRIVACVNAMAGIEQPADALQAIRNALYIAEATIKRLVRHAPGSADGTLDVITVAIKAIGGQS